MKVLFINPSARLIENSRKLKTFISPVLPMGIAYIASVLRDNGIDVKVLDQFADHMPDKLLLKEIRDYAPEVIGFSCLTMVMNNVKALVKDIRAFSDAVIVLGNIHPTIFSDRLLKEKTADVIIRGEGEATALELIQAIRKKSDLKDVKGISFRQDNAVTHNPDRPLIEDLDKLPYPAWDFFELRHYREAPLVGIHNDLVLPISGSRGCPYKCMFCAQDKIFSKPRYRKSEEIIKELEYMHGRFNVRRFGFIDPNFPFSIDFGFKFCRQLIRCGLHKKISWFTETRVDLINEDLLSIMKNSGLNLILFGFETGDKNMIGRVKKQTSLEQAKRVMRSAKKFKIHTVGLFVLGLPGETRESCQKTIEFAKELDCDIAKFNLAIPYPGSKFFEEFYLDKDNGFEDSEIFNPWYDWADRNFVPMYVPEGMKAQELIGLQRKAMFQFYLRPKVIINFLKMRKISLYKLCYAGYILTSKYFNYLLRRLWASPTT
jgi:radical SAM superfamily enzyme YgiQ (UPF0313 family)